MAKINFHISKRKLEIASKLVKYSKALDSVESKAVFLKSHLHLKLYIMVNHRQVKNMMAKDII